MSWWAAIRSYLRIFHRLHVEGIENIPKEPPFVIVANHSSHLDALILASRLSWRLRDDVYPIAAGDTFFETPVAAAFAAIALNALPMWRKRGGGTPRWGDVERGRGGGGTPWLRSNTFCPHRL